MAGRRLFLGVLAVFAMVFAGCDKGLDADLNGTWVRADGYYYKFDNGNYEAGLSTPLTKGTYTADGAELIMTPTLGLSEDGKWLNKDETLSSISDLEWLEYVKVTYTPDVYKYLVDGNELCLIFIRKKNNPVPTGITYVEVYTRK